MSRRGGGGRSPPKCWVVALIHADGLGPPLTRRIVKGRAAGRDIKLRMDIRVRLLAYMRSRLNDAPTGDYTDYHESGRTPFQVIALVYGFAAWAKKTLSGDRAAHSSPGIDAPSGDRTGIQVCSLGKKTPLRVIALVYKNRFFS